jgi:hypothetical protein
MAAFGSIAACAQTDVAASLFGAFTSNTSGNNSLPNSILLASSGNNTVQTPSKAAGVLIEVRHVKNPFIGYEGAYSYNQANQAYYTSATYNSACDLCDATIINKWASVSARSHEVTGAWVTSIKVRNLRPFALAGGGILFNVSSGGELLTNTTPIGPFIGVSSSVLSPISANTTIEPLLVCGGGIDWNLFQRVSLRFQLRDKFYRAPDPAKFFNYSRAFTHSEEPMIGISFRI